MDERWAVTLTLTPPRPILLGGDFFCAGLARSEKSGKLEPPANRSLNPTVPPRCTSSLFRICDYSGFSGRYRLVLSCAHWETAPLCCVWRGRSFEPTVRAAPEPPRATSRLRRRSR